MLQLISVVVIPVVILLFATDFAPKLIRAYLDKKRMMNKMEKLHNIDYAK